MQPAEILDRLDPEQREAAAATRGPVCILAGAGTGKTRTITHRIAYAVATGAAPPSQLLAVTFTTRAAGELRDRLRELGVEGVQARTFHSAALRQLQYFWPRVIGGAMPSLVDNKYALVSTSAARAGHRLGKTEVRDLLSEIEWAKTTLTSPDDYEAVTTKIGREPPMAAADVATVYRSYEELKTTRDQIDFEDLLLLTAASIDGHRDVADEVRARYRHFVVDEYQDVSPLQQRLLDAWLGGRDDLCVVGDANQTIYSFTGATPDYLLQFRTRFPGATVVRLVRDYRSTPQVVTLANRVIAGAATTSPAGKLTLEAQRPDGPEPRFSSYDDEAGEAAGVARRCGELIAAGVRPSEIAVLYRINAQSAAFESALSDAGVAYQVRGGERFFDRPEIREAVMLLRGAARGGDERPLVDAVTSIITTSGWSPEPPPGGAARDRWESLSALRRLAEDLVATLDLTGFVAELERRAAASHAPTVEAVTLASLHAAKGLEWDAVFLVGVVDGTLPDRRSTSPEQLEEERRLFYVGITRAREHLSISWARSRSGGRGSRKPSRFLDGLLPTDLAAAEKPRGERAARRERRGPALCRVCGKPVTAAVDRKLRRCATCPGDVDEVLFEQLREWRSERAREQKVPAYVVFTDATLTAIAENRPTTVADLSAIPGVGQRKLDMYGQDVLDLVGAEKNSE